nr:SDR family NAD(P)-dependent oxidoreductase [uncultured Gellertiella sp.]
MTIMTDLNNAADAAIAGEGHVRMRQAILAMVGVRDVAIRQRLNNHGNTLTVIYLVANPMPSRAQLEAALCGCPGGFATVALSDLPYDGDGQLDEQRLASYPVLEHGLWESHGLRPGLRDQLSWNLGETVIVHAPTSSLLQGPDLPADPAGRLSLADALAYTAATATTSISIIQPGQADRHLPYAALHDLALRIAGGLHAAGCLPGSVVLLQLPHPLSFISLFWGAIHAGVIPVLLAVPGRYVPEDVVAQRLADAVDLFPGAAIICEERMKSTIEAMLPSARQLAIEALSQAPPANDRHRACPRDTAVYLLTSGSTSRPKAVPQTHGNLLAHCMGGKIAHDLQPDEITLNWLPLDHVGGMIMFHLRDLYHGFWQYHASSTSFLQDPLRWLDWMSERGITISWAPNFAFNLVCTEIEKYGARVWDLSHLRFLMNGGEAVVRSQAERFLRMLAPFGLRSTAMRPSWGMSETCSDTVICQDFHQDMADDVAGPVSVGKPYPGISLRIVDTDGRIVPQGTIGALHITGSTVLPAYFENAAVNAASFTADGWFNTGDLGAISRGRLCMMGRAKDLIIINGQNIDPAAVEAQVDMVDGVRPSFTAVIARRERGDDTDRVSVFFVPFDQSAPTAPVLQAIRTRLTTVFGLQVGEIIVLSEPAVPKTSIGKIQKEKLKAALEAGSLVPDYRRAGASNTQESAGRIGTLWRRVWRKRKVQTGEAVPLITILDDGQTGTMAVAHGLTASGSSFTAINSAYLPMVCDAQDRRHFAMLADKDFDIGILLEVLNILGKNSLRTPCQLLVVTVEPEHERSVASIAPLLRTAMDEYPDLKARFILAGANQNLAEILTVEAAEGARETEICWRDGQRYVSRLAPSVLTSTGAAAKLRARGLYVVTGGLGGIGLHLCNDLITRYEARLIIVGRRPRSQLDTKTHAALCAIEARTQASYVAADCEDDHFATAVIQTMQMMQAEKLDGVFHLAGTLSNIPLAQMDAVELRSLIATRREGALASFELAKDLSADFVVMFSSLNAHFGGANVGGYSAACRQQMALASLGQASGAPQIRCINWSMWQETGMLRGYTLATLGERKGFRAMNPEAALACLEDAMASADPVVFVGIDETRPPMHAHTVAEPVALDLLVPHGENGIYDRNLPLTDTFGTAIAFGSTDNAIVHPKTADLSDSTQSSFVDEVTSMLARIWQDILGLDIPPETNDNVFDLGGQSLLMPRIQNAIEKALNIEIDILDLFDFVTLGALSDFVGAKVRAETA